MKRCYFFNMDGSRGDNTKSNKERHKEHRWIQLTLTLPLDHSFQEVFIFFSWVYEVNCSITAVGPCDFPGTFIILKTQSGLIQNPWDCCIYPSSGGKSLCSMRSVSHFPSQWCLWVSLDITKPHLKPFREGWGATRMIWGDKWCILIPLKCSPNSSAILIYIS